MLCFPLYITNRLGAGSAVKESEGLGEDGGSSAGRDGDDLSLSTESSSPPSTRSTHAHLDLDEHVVVVGVGLAALVLLGDAIASTVIEDGDNRSDSLLVHLGSSSLGSEEGSDGSSSTAGLDDLPAAGARRHLQSTLQTSQQG